MAGLLTQRNTPYYSGVTVGDFHPSSLFSRIFMERHGHQIFISFVMLAQENWIVNGYFSAISSKVFLKKLFFLLYMKNEHKKFSQFLYQSIIFLFFREYFLKYHKKCAIITESIKYFQNGAIMITKYTYGGIGIPYI